jgi:murein DD-endopeptidase MepM/ murein hydrolase activator NlpD
MVQATVKQLTLIVLLMWLPYSGVFAQKEKINVFYEKQGDDWVFYASNPTVVPYYLKFQFSELTNLEPNFKLDTYTPAIYPMAKKQRILTLSPQEKDKSRNFNFNYVYTIGEPEKKPDYEYAYLLPYKHGKRVRIAQGNNGSGTHFGVNAIDFNLQIGDTVYASRDGLVYEVKEDSNKGGNNLSFEKYGNYINVYHEDGTIAKYVHLKKDGSWVDVGDQIKAGQAIGFSGNTGYSSGPHLHFMVVHNEDFKSKTLAVQFLNYKSESFIPQEGKSYYAYHPGKGSFEVKDDQTFNEQKFEDNIEASKLNNDIEIVAEEYGDYTLLYVNNGFNRAINGTLKIKLSNMESTKAIPFSFEAQSKSKQYLLAIKPKDPTQKYSYDLSAEFR